MVSPPQNDSDRELERARTSFACDDTASAMAHLERALKLKDDPSWRSFLGYCIARERGQFRRGIELCLSSIEQQSENQLHYYNLGRIHLLMGNKSDAIRIFREGLVHGRSHEIEDKLREIGVRKKPLVRFLPRDNSINKYLGLLLSRLRLR